MIAYLRGTCHSLVGDALVVDVKGVGYLVTVCDTDRVLHSAGNDVELLIHTEVNESQIALYGFVHQDGRELFQLLLSVSGVGPKAAMALIALGPPATVADAIAAGRIGELVKAKGIGKKTAETIVVKLRDRLPKFATVVPGPGLPIKPASPLLADVTSALHNLGFRPQLVEAVASQVLQAQPDATFDTALRLALAQLRRPS